MKRILVIGIVLLALIALTGVVSAAREGKATVKADVQTSTLDLSTSGGISGWILKVGDNSKSGINLMVTNNGYSNGYFVTVADKMDPAVGGMPKPVGTDGMMCALITNINPNIWEGPLSAHLHILANANQGATDLTLSGSDQGLYSTSVDGNGNQDIYTPVFQQTVFGYDEPASSMCAEQSHCADHYEITVTFTATPN